MSISKKQIVDLEEVPEGSQTHCQLCLNHISYLEVIFFPYSPRNQKKVILCTFFVFIIQLFKKSNQGIYFDYFKNLNTCPEICIALSHCVTTILIV